MICRMCTRWHCGCFRSLSGQKLFRACGGSDIWCHWTLGPGPHSGLGSCPPGILCGLSPLGLFLLGLHTCTPSESVAQGGATRNHATPSLFIHPGSLILFQVCPSLPPSPQVHWIASPKIRGASREGLPHQCFSSLPRRVHNLNSNYCAVHS